MVKKKAFNFSCDSSHLLKPLVIRKEKQTRIKEKTEINASQNLKDKTTLLVQENMVSLELLDIPGTPGSKWKKK